MICSSCFQSYLGWHGCKPLDLAEAHKHRIRLGGQAKAMAYYETLEATQAQASIPKPVPRPVTVTDVTVTAPEEVAPDVTVTEPHVTVTQNVQFTPPKGIGPGVTLNETRVTVTGNDDLLEKLVEARRQARIKTRERVRRHREKKRKADGRDSEGH